MAQPRHHFLPFRLVTRSEFDCRRFCRRLKRYWSAPADGAAHVLEHVCRSAIPSVQREPAPQYAPVHDTLMIAESASYRDVGAVSPDFFERFKTASHRLQ